MQRYHVEEPDVILKLLSDFHTEFWNVEDFQKTLNHYLPPHHSDADTVLCCAGDMGVYARYASTYQPLFAILGERFRRVIMIPGNHSWYSSFALWGNERDFWSDKELPANVAYLDDGTTTIDDVTFIGSCLWTNFGKSDPASMRRARDEMCDFSSIHVEYREASGSYSNSHTASITPEATVERHQISAMHLVKSMEASAGRKCVVITHHAPAPLSVPDQDPGYYTDLSDIILKYQPLVWCHGHVHHSSRYKIGATEVICNPLGYHGAKLNEAFDPDLTVSI
jgi:Icc-related predicted phosphoesterase